MGRILRTVAFLTVGTALLSVYVSAAVALVS